MYLSEKIRLANKNKMRRWRAAKDAKREAFHKGEPVRQELRGLHVYTLTAKNELSGTSVEMELRVSDERINSWQVDIAGKVWRERISMTGILRRLGEKMPSVRRVDD